MSFGAVIFTLVVYAVGVLTGAFGNEHANRPELTNDELFDAIDRIVKVCNSDHDKVQGMLDELHRWQYGEAEVELSKGLNEIIEQVKIRK